MIEICAFCVYELNPVNVATPGQYLDYDGETWKPIPSGKVIDIVVAEGRRVRTAYGAPLRPESGLIMFRGTLVCPSHFQGWFADVLKSGGVA